MEEVDTTCISTVRESTKILEKHEKLEGGLEEKLGLMRWSVERGANNWIGEGRRVGREN